MGLRQRAEGSAEVVQGVVPCGRAGLGSVHQRAACIIAMIEAFPDRITEFDELVPDIIAVVKDRTDVVRKNAAVLLAKMAQNEETKKLIRQHHGMDVLLSLRTAF